MRRKVGPDTRRLDTWAKSVIEIGSREASGWVASDLEHLQSLRRDVQQWQTGKSPPIQMKAHDLVAVVDSLVGKIGTAIGPLANSTGQQDLYPDRTRINEYGAASGDLTWATKKRRT